MSDQQGTPFQQPTSAANEFTKLVFVVNQLLRGKATAALVEVLACTNAGGIAPVGTVDVRMLVSQVNGQGGNPEPHGPMYSLPYHRLQGGAFAVIVDPKAGDIGVAVFCSRDSTAAFSSKGQASPASDDVMGFNSGLYLGGFLNGTPASYVAFTSSGIQIVDPQSITLQAPTVTVQATVVAINASSQATIQTATAVIDASAQATIQAPTIALEGTVNQTAGDVTLAQQLTVTGATVLDGGVSVTGGSGAVVTGTVAVTGSVTATVDVTANGKSLHNHDHGPGTYHAGATAVTGTSDPP